NFNSTKSVATFCKSKMKRLLLLLDITRSYLRKKGLIPRCFLLKDIDQSGFRIKTDAIDIFYSVYPTNFLVRRKQKADISPPKPIGNVAHVNGYFNFAFV